MSEAGKAQEDLRKAGKPITAESTRAQVLENRRAEREFREDLNRRLGPGRR